MKMISFNYKKSWRYKLSRPVKTGAVQYPLSDRSASHKLCERRGKHFTDVNEHPNNVDTCNSVQLSHQLSLGWRNGEKAKLQFISHSIGT